MAKENFGKYRAEVVEIEDPEKMGRVKIKCPKVLGDSKSAWCRPCSPYSFDDGGFISIPKIGDLVWVEFEDGDIEYPIYTSGYWKENKTPLKLATSDVRCFKFEGGQIMAFDKDGNICIRTGSSILLMQPNQIIMKSPVVYMQPKGQTADSIFAAFKPFIKD